MQGFCCPQSQQASGICGAIGHIFWSFTKGAFITKLGTSVPIIKRNESSDANYLSVIDIFWWLEGYKAKSTGNIIFLVIY